MTPSAASGTDAEAQRVRAAYGRRGGAERYSWFEGSYVLLAQELERAVLRELRRRFPGGLSAVRVLDVGCGRGAWLQQFVKWGGAPERVTGIDLLEDRVADARRLCAPAMDLRAGNAAALDFPDASFDLVWQFTVFSSILDAEVRRRVAAEMLRVARPGGLVLSYDFRVDNPRNPDVRGIRRGELRRLFPGRRVAFHRVTLAPPIARSLARRSWALCALAAAVPWLRTHDLAVIEP